MCHESHGRGVVEAERGCQSSRSCSQHSYWWAFQRIYNKKQTNRVIVTPRKRLGTKNEETVPHVHQHATEFRSYTQKGVQVASLGRNTETLKVVVLEFAFLPRPTKECVNTMLKCPLTLKPFLQSGRSLLSRGEL